MLILNIFLNHLTDARMSFGCSWHDYSLETEHSLSCLPANPVEAGECSTNNDSAVRSQQEAYMKARSNLLVGVCAIGFASGSQAAWTQWTTASGGNGHYYEVVSVPNLITWDDANTAALSMGGYLATLTSADENAFVFGLADDQAYWTSVSDGRNYGPWLGGFQPPGSAEPGGGWEWVNGEGPFSFTAWSGGEPNNVMIPANNFLGEESLQFWGLNSTRSSSWNDLHTSDFDPGVHAYVVERASIPDAGSTAPLLAGVLGGLALLRRRSAK